MSLIKKRFILTFSKWNRLFYMIVIAVLLVGCKSTKSLTDEGEIKASMTTKQLIRENQKQVAKFRTMQGKIKIDYTEGNSSKGVSVTLRIEKDKQIWLSAPLGAARALITPEKVSFYNKLSDEYFEGDYSLLTDFLGIELDFDKVQNLLLGETLYQLSEAGYQISDDGASYILSPKEQNPLFEIFYLFHPGHFKVNSQQMSQPLKKRILQVDYKSYQLVDKQIFPELMKIIAVEDNEEILIDMEIKSVSLNEELRFPFEIPDGYTQIEIE